VIDKGIVVLQNCMDLVKVELGSYNETCERHSPNGNQIYIKVEDVADIQEDDDDDPFPVVKAEQEVSCMCILLGTFHKCHELCVVSVISSVCPSI
jgi:hypothetical protein